ncbi:MAG TPA: hypothetical protein ENF57_00755 [Candidatus Korarchaeota archaeon]|nr:hypothetical protein [Candidatus Korarchaeota archaeon]HDI73521.1 hypothetical protein [Candidatus Korarchaeota archaeon]
MENEVKVCAIDGCDEPAVKEVDRSFLPFIQELKLKLKGEVGKKIPLCRKHYKMVKQVRDAQLSRF